MTPAGPFTAAVYGTSGLPASGSGANLFAGGYGSERSSGTQVVHVSAYAAAIDAGRAQATLSALLGGWALQEDYATVGAAFLDANGAPLSGEDLHIGPVSAAERGGQTTLLPRSATVPVPPSTRRIEVVITAVRASGDYNEGYADDVSLTLAATAAPPPPASTRYLWGATVLAFGDRGAPLRSAAITGDGWATAPDGSAAATAAGGFRISFVYRKPNGRKRTLALRSTGTVTLSARPGGGGSIALPVRIAASQFNNCRRGGMGRVTLLDGAGARRDSVSLSVCGTTARYVAGGRHRMRVRVTIGEQR